MSDTGRTGAGVEFRRTPIEPFQCLSEAGRLVRGQYWLFVAITFVGMLIGEAVPFGILLGPMICGMFLCYRSREEGARAEFETLFKGFRWFKPSLVPNVLKTAILTVAAVAAIVPFYLAFIPAMVATARDSGPGRAPDLPFLVPFGVLGVAILALTLLSLLVEILFLFAEPLIVERELGGMQALKASASAAWANFWGLLGLTLVNWVISCAGLCLCCVGAYLVLPFTVGANFRAYRRVFPVPPAGPAAT